jgi:hypothetical protein
MNEPYLRTELIGGPHDGCIWYSDGAPEDRQQMTWAAPHTLCDRTQYTDYQLLDSRLTCRHGQPCIIRRYQFADSRIASPSRLSRWIKSLSGWSRRLWQRLTRANEPTSEWEWEGREEIWARPKRASSPAHRTVR